MNFELHPLSLADACQHACDALIVLLPEGVQPKSGADALSTVIAQALKTEDMQPQVGKLLPLYAPEGIAARRVIVLGCADGSAAAVQKAIRQAMQSQSAFLKVVQVKHIALVFANTPAQGAVAAALQTLWEASYHYSATKTNGKGTGKAQERALTQITFGVDPAVAGSSALHAECAQAAALAQGIEFAREWANRPANHATPTLLAQAAQSLLDLQGKSKHLACTIHDPKQVAKLGMGAFMAVARGSEEPLRLIELRYTGADKAAAPVVLVGKGITFDTGGISIKPSAEMDEMKFDMGGAASVLGVFRALVALQPAINVVGLIPACENMPDGSAVKPGDVVTSMSGQTIEILNTDAEGRLVLCDALTYAARFQPAAIIDIATLTGACVISLGAVRSGLFANDDALAARLAAAGDAALDACWRMPLDDEYAQGLKTHFADVANVAGRAGGSITAAKFLQRFVAPGTPWAHLDIAGTAWKSGAAKGATGRPVGLLMHYLLGLASAPAEKTTAKLKKKDSAKTSKAPKTTKAAKAKP